MKTLNELLAVGRDEDVAISAPAGQPLNYAQLRTLVQSTTLSLNAAGIGRNDRVAIVLPNGPEMATSFIAVASAATSAPLNPAYRADEFEFYLSDLNARALVVEQGSSSPAVAVAAKLGIAVIELQATPALGSGAFTLNLGGLAGPCALPGAAQAGDIALVLHTSGTTSRPKIVPLTQTNVCASAGNIATTARFTSEDRGLNVMPLFHIHGLIAGILAPLSRGGSVSCTPGFNALKFFGWMDEVKPTWYTAVPTMHQTIVSRAANNADLIARNPLRFIRSSSSSLPPQVLAELEAVFKAPVIEAYGMTEAAHQMACNPLPPGLRKPGTVGLAAGPEVAIMDTDGALLPVGAIGEIVIRGANITPGYESNAKANAEAFTQGWFRTGDLMRQDSEGYVYFIDRIGDTYRWKGENVSTAEVEQRLADAPGVKEVIAYGVPVPGHEGKAGMVALVVEGRFAARPFADWVEQELPVYARPAFVRLIKAADTTGTFKYRKVDLVADGFDPDKVDGPLYVRGGRNGFTKFSEAARAAIMDGETRL
jgi:acyl-CoA synthetase (AMP-forming)/AMP-acid ligase II